MADEGYDELPKMSREELDEALGANEKDSSRRHKMHILREIFPFERMNFDIRKLIATKEFPPVWKDDDLANLSGWLEVKNNPVLTLTQKQLTETRAALKRALTRDFVFFWMLCYSPHFHPREDADGIALYRFRKYLDSPEALLSPEQIKFRKFATERLLKDVRELYYDTIRMTSLGLSLEDLIGTLRDLKEKYCHPYTDETTDEH